MTATLTPNPKQQFFDANGNPLVGGKLYSYQAGTSTPLATYVDQAATTTNANPIILDSRGEANVWLGTTAYKLALYTATDVLVWTVDNISAADALALADLSQADGSSLVGYLPAGTGAVATTVQAKLRESLDAVNDFGCDNTGATNTTTALLAFYSACISSGKRGHIPAGTYKVTTGTLIFDNGQTDKEFPIITTDGHYLVTFSVDSATATNAAVLAWSNGTSSGSSYLWRGGYHGGVTISDATGATAANRNGINLTGTWGLKFGWMRFSGVRGSAVCVPAKLYGGTNPDVYASSFTEFDAIEAVSPAGYALNNLNYVGMDSWRVKRIYATGCGLGGVFGVGSGCRIDEMAIGNSQGWAFDDGTQAGATGGPPQRNAVGVAEFDNVQYGIRLNKSSFTDFNNIRFIHRYQTSPNVSANYYPRQVVDLTAGSSPNVTNVTMQINNRIESGGVLGDLGQFLNAHSSGNITTVNIDADYADNGGLGVTDSWLTASAGVSWTTMPMLLTRKTKALFDSRDKAYFFAIGDATTTVPNAGMFSVAAKINFINNGAPTYSNPFSLATDTFTAPREGLYLVSAAIPLTTAVGTKVRLAVMTSGGGAELRSEYYSVNAGVQTYNLNGAVKLAAGATMYLCADQNTGTAALPVTLNSNVNECRFVVSEL